MTKETKQTIGKIARFLDDALIASLWIAVFYVVYLTFYAFA
jgi:hypothetical protein